jgi:hypothetical protein
MRQRISGGGQPTVATAAGSNTLQTLGLSLPYGGLGGWGVYDVDVRKSLVGNTHTHTHCVWMCGCGCVA